MSINHKKHSLRIFYFHKENQAGTFHKKLRPVVSSIQFLRPEFFYSATVTEVTWGLAP